MVNSPNISNIIDVSEATFEQEVLERSRDVTVIVDFWAPWCGPCRMLGPILERLANDAENNFVLAKLNVDDNPSIATQYRVQGIPAVKAFRDGEVVDEFVGAQPEPRVRDFVKNVAPNATDSQFQEVERLITERSWAQAETLLRQLPEKPRTILSMAKALLGQGKGCEAQETLKKATDASIYAEAEQLQPLADYLCEAENPALNGEEPPTFNAQYWRVADLIRRSNLEAALDGLLELLRHDKHFHDGQAKQVVLGIFALLGDQDPLTRQYRPELAMVIF